MAPRESTGRELSSDWSHHRISSTDSKGRVTLQNSIKHCGSERVNCAKFEKIWILDPFQGNGYNLGNLGATSFPGCFLHVPKIGENPASEVDHGG